MEGEEEEEEEAGHCATALKKPAAATARFGLLQRPAAAPVTLFAVMTQRTRLHGGLLVQLPRGNVPRHSSLLRGPRTRTVCLPVGLMAGSTRSQLWVWISFRPSSPCRVALARGAALARMQSHPLQVQCQGKAKTGHC